MSMMIPYSLLGVRVDEEARRDDIVSLHCFLLAIHKFWEEELYFTLSRLHRIWEVNLAVKLESHLPDPWKEFFVSDNAY